MVYSGLTRTVCGYLVHLERDEITRTARVRVSKQRVGSADLNAGYQNADASVKVTAEMFAAQARRTLGLEWKVKGWNGEVTP